MILASPASAVAAILFVDQGNPACSDTGAGTQAKPYCTIVKAAVVAVGGQTIQVAAGTYTGTASFGHSGDPGNPIVVTAAPGVVVNGAQGVQHLDEEPHRDPRVHGHRHHLVRALRLRLDDITWTATTSPTAGQPVDGLTRPGIYVNSSTSVEVLGNTVDHNSDSGIVVTNGSTAVDVRGNVSFANARGYTRAAAGIDIREGSGITVARQRVARQRGLRDQPDDDAEQHGGRQRRLLETATTASTTGTRRTRRSSATPSTAT